jgi:hypothetical protein
MKFGKPISGSVVTKSTLEELQELVHKSYERSIEVISDEEVFHNPNKNVWLPVFILGMIGLIMKIVFF